MKKEFFQIIRDPSSYLIAIFLPLMMIFLFAYGVSLDANIIRIGIVLEDMSPLARSIAAAFKNTPYFQAELSDNREKIENDLAAALIRGFIVIPQDFSKKVMAHETATIQIIADGSETNTASFVENYAQGVIQAWLVNQNQASGVTPVSTITTQSRVWFNPELRSRDVLLPGSLAVTMALIGTLLTALVVAREWERGTMEAILATPIRIDELIIGKLLPYFMLGMCSMAICVIITVNGFSVPFHGSIWIMALSTALFLMAALGQGLLISTLAKNQFVASQAAINAAFLPAYMLSGFLYEIDSMPWPIRLITHLLPARYFVSIIKTNFLTGVVWSQMLPNLLAMFVLGTLLLFIVAKKTKRRLD
ncbi:MAG TPA: ABC transporter permease [Candidatus Berkiella sp.]|nr:ABC transporter permease [Candidatus Berkiella sp.]